MLKLLKTKYLLLGCLVFLYLIIPTSIILAQSTVEGTPNGVSVQFRPQIGIPGGAFTGNVPVDINGSSLINYIIAIYKYGIGVAGILGALVMMYGGTLWLTAGDNSSKVSDAKDWIKASLLGTTLLFCAFLLLSTINPALVEFKPLNIKTITGRVYDATSGDAKVVAAIITPNVQEYACCMISGELAGSGWLFDTDVERCATYQVSKADVDAGKAATECTNFYANYKKTIDGTQYHLTSGNGTIVEERKCWELQTSAANLSTCMGNDDKDYCNNRDNGITCRKRDGENIINGFCFNHICTPCLKYGASCIKTGDITKSYGCKNQSLNEQSNPNGQCGDGKNGDCTTVGGYCDQNDN